MSQHRLHAIQKINFPAKERQRDFVCITSNTAAASFSPKWTWPWTYIGVFHRSGGVSHGLNLMSSWKRSFFVPGFCGHRKFCSYFCNRACSGLACSCQFPTKGSLFQLESFDPLNVDCFLFFVGKNKSFTVCVHAPFLTIPPANVGHIQGKPSDAPAKKYLILRGPLKADRRTKSVYSSVFPMQAESHFRKIQRRQCATFSFKLLGLLAKCFPKNHKEWTQTWFLGWHANEIPENPQHPNPLHWNAHHGPNLYDPW